MFKKFLLIISLFTIFNQSVQTFAEIIPLKKPIQTVEEKEKRLLVYVLKPLQKPSTKKVIKIKMIELISLFSNSFNIKYFQNFF